MINILFEIKKIEEKSERELVERLFDLYAKKIKGLAYKILLNQQDAEDALGNTFLRIIKYRQKFVDIDEDEIKRLIVIYTRSTCFDMLDKRDKQKFISISSDFEDDEGNEVSYELVGNMDILRDYICKECLEHVTSIIQNLKTPAREIVLLKYYYDTPNTVISELLGMNVSTVGTIIQRSVAKIKKEMKEWAYHD